MEKDGVVIICMVADGVVGGGEGFCWEGRMC